MIILHPYAEASRETGRQAATWAALEDVCGRWPVRDIPCGRDGRYEAAVWVAWASRDDWVICEHDIAPQACHFAALDACPYPLCAWLYPYWYSGPSLVKFRQMAQRFAALPPAVWAETWTGPVVQALQQLAAMPGDHPWTYVARVADPTDPTGSRYCTETDAWADWVGFGLTRLCRDVTRRVPPAWDPGPWGNLDSRVANYLHRRGVQAHLHTTLPLSAHHHNCPCHAEDASTRGPTIFEEHER